MAKAKTEGNKSAAIREAEKAMPNAKAKDIVTYLKNKGIDVTDGLVYQVRKMDKNKKSAPKPVPQPTVQVAAPVPSPNGVLSVGASIALVKATAEKLGGLAALKEIVDELQ